MFDSIMMSKMEREISSFDIYVIVSELQDLIGNRIEKIYQLARDELLIKTKDIETRNKKNIFVRNEKLLCKTQKQFTVPTVPSMFVMILRKYLMNGKITKIIQHEFDRIIKIKIQKEEEYTLIFELFKKGNIILVNPENKIIMPFRSQQWAHRLLKPHELYVPPPPQKNLFNLNFQDFSRYLKESNKDIVRALAVDLNLSGTYAEEICLRTNIDKNTKIQDLDSTALKKIYFTLVEFLELFKKKKFQPTYVTKDGEIIDILPFPFLIYKEQKSTTIDTFNLGLQELIDTKKSKKYEPALHQKKVEKLQRQLIQQNKSIEEFKKIAEQKKKEGDIIYLNFQQCQELLDEISHVLKEKHKEREIQKINKKSIVKEFDPISNKLLVLLPDNNGKIHKIELNFRKNVAENAEEAYAESKKYRQKIEGAKQAIKNTQKTIRLLKEKDIEISKETIKRTKQFWFENYRWSLSSEGNIIVAGKDAKSNEKVVKKYLKEGDRYVHADIHGAPSCIVKNIDVHDKKIPITEKTLKEACIFAACYSKAWKQFGESQAYWVSPGQVSKTPQSGEFLPKGAFVIRGKRNYCRCKLELAIGTIVIGDTKKIMGGAIDSVKKHSNNYVVLGPGSIKRKDILHILSKAFNASPDEIMNVLPPGDVQIVNAVGINIKQR